MRAPVSKSQINAQIIKKYTSQENTANENRVQIIHTEHHRMHTEHIKYRLLLLPMFRRHLYHLQGALGDKCAFIGVTNEYFSQDARNEVSK
jgi:hypothetical protein